MAQAGQKRCSKCGQLKPLGEFYAARDCAQGRRPECKGCAKAYHRAWARSRYVPSKRGRYRKAGDAP